MGGRTSAMKLVQGMQSQKLTCLRPAGSMSECWSEGSSGELSQRASRFHSLHVAGLPACFLVQGLPGAGEGTMASCLSSKCDARLGGGLMGGSGSQRWHNTPHVFPRVLGSRPMPFCLHSYLCR